MRISAFEFEVPLKNANEMKQIDEQTILSYNIR